MSSKQVGFYFDQQYCIGCHTCQIACKDKNNLRTGENIRTVYEDGETSWISMSCNHCTNPSCIKACPASAIEKRQNDGIVLLNYDKCIGCGKCLKECEYHAIYYDKVKKKAGKCDFCLDLLEKGEGPVCVTACPLRVLDWGEVEELERKL